MAQATNWVEDEKMIEIYQAFSNEVGDIVCPHCGTAHITPDDMEVRPGIALCLACQEPFKISVAVAEEANRLSEDLNHGDAEKTENKERKNKPCTTSA